MTDLIGYFGEMGETYKDSDVLFNDGSLYIITEPRFNMILAHKIIICPEYDEPISLVDIRKKYKNVKKVIYEEAMRGAIFNYGNHEKNEWELVGRTCGYI